MYRNCFFYEKLNFLFLFLNSFVPLMVGRFKKRKYNEIFSNLSIIFMLWGFFFMGVFIL